MARRKQQPTTYMLRTFWVRERSGDYEGNGIYTIADSPDYLTRHIDRMRARHPGYTAELIERPSDAPAHWENKVEEKQVATFIV